MADPRTRMIEAMLTSIGEQGYSATVVADVIAKAVASRKTFYEHFEDKHACFFAMSEEIVDEWVARVELSESSANEEGHDAIHALVNELFALALENPASLRVIAVELTAAGPAGIERRELALYRLAQPLRDALSGKSDDIDLLARTIVGAVLRILYARTRRGAGVRRPRKGALLALLPEVSTWASSYTSYVSVPLAPGRAGEHGSTALVGGRAPGTLSLGSRAIERRGLPRGEGNVSRSFVVHNQRERILDALANLAAVKGFGAITIPEIVQEAAVSVQAFYEHFSGKEDAFLVAYELGHRKALAIVERAYETQEEWPTAVRVGATTLLEFLAAEPAYAHLALIDALTASPKAAAVAHDGMNAYAWMLEPGLGPDLNGDAPTALAVEATTGALLELCFVYVAAERTRELPDLSGFAAEIALRPFADVNVR
ncbi:MAG TPA: TetR/AcrR family transcriptional regulator [Solirubrobacteraceae bacterium]